MHGEVQLLLETVALAVFLGIGAQVVSERFKIPAILPLLFLGVAVGPHGFGLFDPSVLGDGMEVFIKLGVAIILFEGGLSLDPHQLRRVGAAVRNLLTVGVVVTGVGGAWLARAVTGMSWPSAALFGAIVTVTGPTVIVPLLRHMIAPRRVRTVLVSEGLIVDPIGAVLAYLVLQWIERTGQPFGPLTRELLVLAFTGAVLGFVAGSLAKWAVTSRLVGRELRNLVTLALLVGCFVLAEQRVPESGILASVVMGLTMSAANIPDLEPLRSFKEQLTVLLISVLFILLSGQLDLMAVIDLGWRGVVVGFGIILLVRPAAVFASVWPRHLDLRQRTMLALTAPRGIVAAAVASLSAIQLRVAGIEGAALLEGLVYLVIVMTGTWATIMAVVLPRAFGYVGDPSRRLTVLVGANALAVALAEALKAAGRKVVVVDAVRRRLERIQSEGILTVRGDARDAATYETAGVERDTQVLAITTNDELNLLAAELVRAEFGVEHPVVAMHRPPEELGSRRRAWVDLFGGRGVDVGKWMRRVELEKARVMSVSPADEQARLTLRELVRGSGDDEAVYLCGLAAGEPVFQPDLESLERFDAVIVLVAEGSAAQALEPYRTLVAGEEAESWVGPVPELADEPPAPALATEETDGTEEADPDDSGVARGGADTEAGEVRADEPGAATEGPIPDRDTS